MSSIKIKGLIGAVSAWLLLAPDLLIECLHGAFELLEFSLDRLVEHTLHTDRHTTQMIVFYLLLSLSAFPVYRLLRLLPDAYIAARRRLSDGKSCLSDSLRNSWRANKRRWCLGLSIGLGVFMLGSCN